LLRFGLFQTLIKIFLDSAMMDNSPSTSRSAVPTGAPVAPSGCVQAPSGLAFLGPFDEPCSPSSAAVLALPHRHPVPVSMAPNFMAPQQQQQAMVAQQMCGGQQSQFAIALPSAGAAGPPPAEPFLCAGCGRKIVDRFMLQALDKLWHEDCLKVAVRASKQAPSASNPTLRSATRAAAAWPRWASPSSSSAARSTAAATTRACSAPRAPARRATTSSPPSSWWCAPTPTCTTWSASAARSATWGAPARLSLLVSISSLPRQVLRGRPLLPGHGQQQDPVRVRLQRAALLCAAVARLQLAGAAAATNRRLRRGTHLCCAFGRTLQAAPFRCTPCPGEPPREQHSQWMQVS